MIFIKHRKNKTFCTATAMGNISVINPKLLKGYKLKIVFKSADEIWYSPVCKAFAFQKDNVIVIEFHPPMLIDMFTQIVRQ